MKNILKKYLSNEYKIGFYLPHKRSPFLPIYIDSANYRQVYSYLQRSFRNGHYISRITIDKSFDGIIFTTLVDSGLIFILDMETLDSKLQELMGLAVIRSI
jgi:hypothetical protein